MDDWLGSSVGTEKIQLIYGLQSCLHSPQHEDEEQYNVVISECELGTLAIPTELALSSGMPWLVLSPRSHIP